jgi:hypothetical protein
LPGRTTNELPPASTRCADVSAYCCRVGHYACIEAIAPGLEQGSTRLGRLDRERACNLAIADPCVDRAIQQSQRDRVVVEPGDFDLGRPCKPDRGGADAQFGARARRSRQPGSRGDGPVDRQRHPLAVALVCHVAFDEARAADARGRIRVRRRGEADQRERACDKYSDDGRRHRALQCRRRSRHATGKTMRRTAC